MKKQKIIISCGGTGGHIFPALEIAKSLQKKDSNLDLLFVGAYGKMEMTQVPKAGFSIIGLWIQGIYRKSIIKNTLLPLKFFISLIHSFFILLKHRPLAVIGTGGFASFPVLYVASFLKIKTYIQEQNCYPGLANRLLGKRVKKVFVAHNGMETFFPKNKILNFGNPVRKSLKIATVSKQESREFFGLEPNTFTILVVGGSLGANPINEAIATFLGGGLNNDCSRRVHLFGETHPGRHPSYNMTSPDHTDKEAFNLSSFQFIWQTGSKDYEQFKHWDNRSKSNPHLRGFPKLSIHSFIDNMDMAYNAADIVVSRAGAIAIAEICFLSKASILIPSPFVTDNHQKKNAEYLQNKDAALMVADNVSISPLNLMRQIYPFTKDLASLHQMGKSAHSLFQYDAADEISNIVLKETT